MASLAGLYRRWPSSQISIPKTHSNTWWHCYLLSSYPSCRTRWFGCGAESARSASPAGKNAYELLGVLETSSFAEIKASFRKLAKETHPDLAESKNDSAASQRFVQILAAYEILSDIEKRAHYDRYLSSQRRLMQKHSGQESILSAYRSHVTTYKQMEVVEWLKWYRFAINDILSERKVVVGTGYFDVLEKDFYSAIHTAYYGPVIDFIDLLPDCFEAEERSVYETPEVLHLVSGRDLFGMVCVVNKVPELSFSSNEKLTSSASMGSGLCPSVENGNICRNSDGMDDFGISLKESQNIGHKSDAYRDLELHVSGRVVAMATRVPPERFCDETQNEDAQDQIRVFLSSHEDPMHNSKGLSKDHFPGGSVGSSIPLGTIIGLGTTPDEGSCFVYNSSGTKTHVIMKHRTLMVKHMHWYGVGETVSVCECRCSRARLPPSKFWLFEPRCGMHDIGGWYVETFGRGKKGQTVPSQRYWDGFDASEQFEKRLHPAMYLLALAYRTLDLEDVKRRKQTVRGIVERQLYRVLSLCKKLV